MKKNLCLVFALCVCRASAGTVVVETLHADGVRTREVSFLPEPPADAMVYYAFTDDLGGLVKDSSTNGHDAVAAGCVWSSNGPFNGGAMSFAGNASSIPVASAPDFPTWGRYSVSVWFLHDGGGDFTSGYGHKILDKTMFYHDWHIRLMPTSGSVGVTLYESASVGMGTPAGVSYMDNAWHHLVVVRDGANGQLWVDGVLKSSVSNMISVRSDSPVCVGNSLSADFLQRKGWSGRLDEIMVFNRPLSQEEVLGLFQGGATTLPPPINVTADVAVDGGLTVTGEAVFEGGIRHVLPLGDLSSGDYAGAP